MGASLGLVGIVDKGIYDPNVIYAKGNFVLYEGSTWLALKNNLQGVEPAEGESWKFLARGFAAEILSLITAVDSAGLVGNAGAETDGQTLLDAIADKVANQLLEKKMMSNVQVNDETMVPTSALAYAMQQAITDLNQHLWVTFDGSQSLLTQVEQLSNGVTLGYILSSGNKDATGVPIDTNFYVRVLKYNDSYIGIELYNFSINQSYYKTKAGGIWSEWNSNALKSEIDSGTFTAQTDGTNGYYETVVNFNHAFISKPRVVLTPHGSFNADNCMCIIKSVGLSSFVVRVYLKSVMDTEIDWIAVGI